MQVEIVKIDANRNIQKNSTRVKAFIINSRKEILLALSRGGCQLPGGHLENGENITEGLLRELEEETGITFENNFTRFFEAQYTGNDGYISKVIYHYTFSDKEPNIQSTHYTEQEIEYNFQIIKTPLITLPKLLDDYRKVNTIPINIAIIDELKLAHQSLLKALEERNKQKRVIESKINLWSTLI